MMPCCIMWLLVFICMSAVGAVPASPAQGAASPVTAGAASLNHTQNATSSVSAILRPLKHSAETLEALQNGQTVHEGDIVNAEDRTAVLGLWRDATVPYVISRELYHRGADIQAAFKMISASTCITFKKHTTEFNYLKFVSSRGCASSVGCQGGEQRLFYSETCSVGNLCHELMHALGLHHEHTRTDRDQFVIVNRKNIIPGRQKDFDVNRRHTSNLPYDFNSIMHYGPYFFSVNGSPTMLPKWRDMQIGQRTHLSYLDNLKLNKLYHCEERRKARITAG